VGGRIPVANISPLATLSVSTGRNTWQLKRGYYIDHVRFPDIERSRRTI
jgi:hypothetical protein